MTVSIFTAAYFMLQGVDATEKKAQIPIGTTAFGEYNSELDFVMSSGMMNQSLYQPTLHEGSAGSSSVSSLSYTIPCSVNLINGINYTGQGTTINNTLSGGIASVSGNYVSVPVKVNNVEKLEQVPLKYSLKYQDGNSIGAGIKWTLAKGISEYSDINSLFQVTTLNITQYYISATQIKQILYDDLEAIENAIGKGGLGWILDAALEGAGLVIDWTGKVIMGGVFQGIGIALLFMNGNDLLAGMVRARQINTMQGLLLEAERQNLTLGIVNTTYYSTVVGTAAQYFNIINFTTTQKTYVSMKHSDNSFGNAFLTGTKNYGTISYITNTSEIMSAVKAALQVSYPVCMPWK